MGRKLFVLIVLVVVSACGGSERVTADADSVFDGTYYQTLNSDDLPPIPLPFDLHDLLPDDYQFTFNFSRNSFILKCSRCLALSSQIKAAIPPDEEGFRLLVTGSFVIEENRITITDEGGTPLQCNARPSTGEVPGEYETDTFFWKVVDDQLIFELIEPSPTYPEFCVGRAYGMTGAPWTRESSS